MLIITGWCSESEQSWQGDAETDANFQSLQIVLYTTNPFRATQGRLIPHRFSHSSLVMSSWVWSSPFYKHCNSVLSSLICVVQFRPAHFISPIHWSQVISLPSGLGQFSAEQSSPRCKGVFEISLYVSPWVIFVCIFILRAKWMLLRQQTSVHSTRVTYKRTRCITVVVHNPEISNSRKKKFVTLKYKLVSH